MFLFFELLLVWKVFDFSCFMWFLHEKTGFCPKTPVLNHFKIVQQAESDRAWNKLSDDVCLENSHMGGRVYPAGPWSIRGKSNTFKWLTTWMKGRCSLLHISTCAFVYQILNEDLPLLTYYFQGVFIELK